MGIRFLCPNGHKLNVKSYLSGKKAICPKCGVRVVVPSALSEDDEADEESDSSVTVAALDTGAAVDASTDGDAIDESPAAVWYVRPATGGQFGPASSDIMRAWIKEGRVGASSLVWRAGWPEWRSAAATFPQLGTLLASPAVAVAPPQAVPSASPVATVVANGSGPTLAGGFPLAQSVQAVAAGLSLPADVPNPALSQSLRRRKQQSNNLVASAILALVSIVLVIVLVVVWRSRAVDEEFAAPSPPSAKAELPQEPPKKELPKDDKDFSDAMLK